MTGKKADLILVTKEGELIWTAGLWEAGVNYVDWTSDRTVAIAGYLLVYDDSIKMLSAKGLNVLMAGDTLRVTVT